MVLLISSAVSFVLSDDILLLVGSVSQSGSEPRGQPSPEDDKGADADD